MMFTKRIAETEEGIQDEMTVEMFDRMQKGLRDGGHMPITGLEETGITSGLALEIGPGPGYFGLEWLKATEGTRLEGLEISPAMIRTASKNADQYGLMKRARYVEGNALSMPFEEERFDAVFSNGSLHEWEDAMAVFNEIARVLKRGGKYCISDLRRDLEPGIFRMMKENCNPPEIRPGFESSVRAAYTKEEIEAILKESDLGGTVFSHPYGILLSGQKK